MRYLVVTPPAELTVVVMFLAGTVDRSTKKVALWRRRAPAMALAKATPFHSLSGKSDNPSYSYVTTVTLYGVSAGAWKTYPRRVLSAPPAPVKKGWRLESAMSTKLRSFGSGALGSLASRRRTSSTASEPADIPRTVFGPGVVR